MKYKTEVIASQLNGKKTASGFMALCPAHNDRNPSLSLTEKNGKILFHCFSGCTQEQVINAFKAKGLWSHQGGLEAVAIDTSRANSANLAKNGYIRELAEKIWNESKPLSPNHDNAGIKYLRRRGLKFYNQIESIRFHPALDYFQDGKSIGKFPVLVSKVVDVEGNFLAIHRVYLDESGNKANLDPVKLVLGKIATGSIRLDVATDVLNITEGLETALAVREMTGQPTWSAISATNLKALCIPATVGRVIIWADLDRKLTGELAASELALMLRFDGVIAEVRLPDEKYLTETSKSFDWLDYYNQNNK